jgi:methionyl-tRNA formyltransferase
MGTPTFSVPSLEAVARACEVVAVVTQPDRPRGRGRAAAPTDLCLL